MNLQFKSVNPFNNKIIKQFDFHTVQQLDDKIQFSWQSFLRFRQQSLDQRLNKLRNIQKILLRDQEKLAHMMSLEMGKPISQSLGEITKSVGHIQYYLNNSKDILQQRTIKTEGSKTYSQYGNIIYIYNHLQLQFLEPLGPILEIQPWNFPFWLPFRCAIPTMVLGNTVLFKGAPSVPQCNEALERIFIEAGFDNYEFQNIFASIDHTELLISHKYVRGLSFTGSTQAGKILSAYCGKYMKKITCELGGSDPFIVLEDANIDKAVDKGIFSRLVNSGQACINAKRFIIHEKVYDSFKQKLVKGIQGVKVGDQFDKEVVIGPLARRDLLENLKRQVKDTIADGATVVFGDVEQLDQDQVNEHNCFTPIILENISSANSGYHQEFFGPVFNLYKVSSEQQAIDLANDTEYGLCSAIFSEDVEKAQKLGTQIEAGMVFINDFVRSDSRIPVGGVKSSGLGKECGPEGIFEFANLKTYWIS